MRYVPGAFATGAMCAFRSGAGWAPVGLGLGGGEGGARGHQPGVGFDFGYRRCGFKIGAAFEGGDAFAAVGRFGMLGMEIGFRGMIVVDGGHGGLCFVAGRGRFVGFRRSGGDGGLLDKAGAMLRGRLDLSGEDKGRDERQHDAGQPWKHARKIVSPVTPVNDARFLAAIRRSADGPNQGHGFFALDPVGRLG